MMSSIRHSFKGYGTNFPTLYLPTLLFEILIVISALLVIINLVENGDYIAVILICIAIFFFMLFWASMNLAVPRIFGIKSGELILTKKSGDEISFRVQVVDFFLFFNPWLMGDAKLINADADKTGSYILLDTYYFIPIKIYMSQNEFEDLLTQL